MKNKVQRIGIAMSGGTDSSVAAAMLVDQGYEVIGFTAHMWKDGSRCCSVEDVERAKKVSWQIGIDHYVINAEDAFTENVVDPFIVEYLNGRTPSPCVMCNRKVKFGVLMTRAVQLDCTHLATGHYAHVEQADAAVRLFRSKDHTRDQSYFLHRLSQRQLCHCMFPLENMMKKTEVTGYAHKHELPLSSRGESQDLCFVPPDQYANFVESRCESVPDPGDIINTVGETVGSHTGIHRYTIGQRKGLNVHAATPLYVLSIDPDTNTITVGPRNDAMARTCTVSDVSWISGTPVMDGLNCQVRLRYRHEAAPARLSLEDDHRVSVVFTVPQFAITPGQAAVFYDGDEVLGGGWIEKEADTGNVQQ